MPIRENNHGYKRRAFDNLIFGRHPVFELLNGNKTIDKLLIQQSANGDIIQEIKQIALEKEIPLQYVPVEKLNKLTGGNHQGIIAFTTDILFQKISNVLPFIIENGEAPLLIMLDGITDVRNFGAIARTAYAAGVHAIILFTSNAAPVNSEAMKASAGALEKIPICRENSIVETCKYLQLNGIHIIGADANAYKFVSESNLKDPVAIIMGSEDEGISSAARKYLHQTIKIPMFNTLNSYNVSVAAGMILYEAMLQRM